ncbi:MAG: 6-phosphogluconolactonase [Chthoniobacteraceae bacterium]|nr:6-phosphogluconolactonase [Chthoniobacteraceae bacterium]
MKLFPPLASMSLAAITLLNVASADERDFYVGTYTKKEGSHGIYHYRLDPQTGKVTGGELAAESESPSFLAVHPGGKFVYAVNESKQAVSAFAIGEGGKLTALNQQPSGGADPCHISIAGNYALIANYTGGSLESLPIEKDGSLGKPSDFIQHSGSGPDKKRQEKAHAHSIYPFGGFIYSCDLGTDHVNIYKLDPAKGTLAPNDPASARVAPGSGPRHLAFHEKNAYVINEMVSTISLLTRDPNSGALSEPVQTISTLPDGFKGSSTTAEIFVHPNGKFVYGSNRGHDSIAVFSIGADGKLTAIEQAGTQGKTPRGFGIDPTGNWLIAGNQDSNSLVIFAIDSATGKLKPTGQKLEVGMPVSVAFVPAAAK